MKRTAIIVAALALAVAPASAAKRTTCTSESMAKTAGAANTMPAGPAKFALDREIGAINSDLSKGNMRGACAHYARAQMITGGR